MKKKPYCLDEAWPGRADCKHCAVRDTVLFSAMSDAELESELQHIDTGWHEAGSVLFTQDAKAEHIYTLRAGCVKIVHPLDDGGARIVRLHYPGDAMGLEALLGEPYHNTAIVLQKADMCRIPVEVIETLKQRNPQLHEHLVQRWQKALDEAERFISQLNTGKAERRLAWLLLRLEAGSATHTIPDLLREDIASIIGVSLETASRLMADFRRRKLVQRGKNRSLCCDAAALKLLA